MENEETKLKKLVGFGEDKDLAIFDELQEMNEHLKEMCEKEDPEYPEPKDFPEVQKVEVINQKDIPEVQKVEVVNQKDPVINVTVPPVNVPETIVNIDTEDLKQGLKDIKDTIEAKEETEYTKENPLPVVLVWKEEEYKAEGGKTTVQGGFGGGSALLGIEQNTADTVTALQALGGGAMTTLLDKITTTNITYVGKAPVGSATSSAVWQVFKIDKTGATIKPAIRYAGTGAFDQIYDNRVSLTYN